MGTRATLVREIVIRIKVDSLTSSSRSLDEQSCTFVISIVENIYSIPFPMDVFWVLPHPLPSGNSSNVLASHVSDKKL